jgi:hypothetical protein
MEHFLVKLVFQIKKTISGRLTEFDEQFRFVKAENYTQALKIAEEIGRSEEISFLTTSQKELNWKFIGVMELFALGNLSNKSLVFQTTHETTNTKGFISFVNQRAEILRNSPNTQPLVNIADFDTL